ncbi:MAG: sigma-54-dependent Fis family transcriptional regulator [Syntrophales bacterium]|jgi:transcriptional regulator of acetoin/glycerol metabolism|nr:sigma-54-dependent Fis family transcriptional regulator [Syntrophales bacterium]MDD2301599.1 sigma-54-dependent Fis family transcriptional regulator [Eubacteriales bacterium]MDD4338746.1 sigma-54-dependent Fis family transcriptional regulator [Syntrophales bacterium]HQN25034.1 sigma-54-dependent Fis family transcriptional regulator [Syntrophales bacterium]HQP27807.1 sigma-54-dependent Fis family transcriptional regulator [Syntrophales bacterium]
MNRQLYGINSSFKKHIVKSWEQCTSLAIDPELNKAPRITEEEFLICQKRKQLLLKIVQPIISKYSPFFDYAGYSITLTDEKGIILYFYGKDEFIRESCELGYDIGSNWSEESVGTNAIGTCLANGQPICIVGDDHYVRQWRNYGCAASPIRDPFSGEIIGSMNLACHVNNFHVFSLCIAESLAIILETTLRVMSNTYDYNRHDLIIEKFLEASKEADMRDGIIAIDLNGNIIATNKVVHSMLVNERCAQHKNIFQLRSKLQEILSRSKSSAVSFSTNIEKNVNSDETYLANFRPIFDNNKIHEGWIGRLLNISSGGKAYGRTVVGGVKENYLQPIYISSSMSKVINKARKVANFSSTKLILGESGVGKEIIAKFIHVNGPRAAHPMISLNCAAIPKELLASELFGYEAGAFTGAKQKGSPGKFQMANRGTIYLDEIGDMSLDLQAYLLRVIEEKKVTRLGGTKSIPIDVQIITSTNRDLKKLVEENKFRLDLYYRLNVITIRIPSLRERKDDILPLAEFFLEKMKGKLDGVKKKLSPDVIEALLNYNWPGNVRELEHVIEMAHAISNGEVINLGDIKEEILSEKSRSSRCFISDKTTNREDDKIQMAIKMSAGNMSRAAQILEVSRTTLYRKMRKYDIPLKSSNRLKDIDKRMEDLRIEGRF